MLYARELQDYFKNDYVIIHHTTVFPKIMGNQAMLMAAYLIVCHRLTAEMAWKHFNHIQRELTGFCDSGTRYNRFEIQVMDCLNALEKAIKLRWCDFNSFNTQEYFRLNQLANGDINWIIPGEILAMSSPSTSPRDGALKPSFFT